MCAAPPSPRGLSGTPGEPPLDEACWLQGQMPGAGVVINVPGRARLLEDLHRRLDCGAGFAVATLNLDHVVKLKRQPAFREAYAAHSHVTADGHPVVWLSRLAGQRTERVTGSDLVDPLMALAAELGVRVAFVGSTAAALTTAAARLRDRHPALDVVARISPPMGFDPEGPAADRIVEELRAARADLCLLALGAPKQEIFAAHAIRRLPGAGFVSVGAGLDFIAGAQTRAPRWVQALAAEWVWRLAQDPGRMTGRYMACLAILPGLVGAALSNRLRHPRQSAP